MSEDPKFAFVLMFVWTALFAVSVAITLVLASRHRVGFVPAIGLATWCFGWLAYDIRCVWRAL